MKSFSSIDIKEFSYELPVNRIAKQPLDKRDQSKLLVYKRGEIYERNFGSIVEELPEGNLLVRNNTRVIQARLIFQKSTGANIEIFCLEPVSPPGYEMNFASANSVEWLCMVGNAKKWKGGSLEMNITFGKNTLILRATLINQFKNEYLIGFDWGNSEITFADILESAGSTPIPPYLNREAEDRDKKWYQTVYAQLNGSVAAPTAGLHFTEEVFASLKSKNIKIEEVTLHVGAGTFRPVQSDKISEHIMHVESIIVAKQTILNLIDHLKTGITAVGTTSLRTLESLYWLGHILFIDKTFKHNPIVGQWDPYNQTIEIEPKESLNSIVEYMDNNSMEQISFSTQLIIMPGYKFRLVNRLITNFHQPGSTLLLLVAAFIGDKWRSVYDYALEHNFRFLSYGDSSVLEAETNN